MFVLLRYLDVLRVQCNAGLLRPSVEGNFKCLVLPWVNDNYSSWVLFSNNPWYFYLVCLLAKTWGWSSIFPSIAVAAAGRRSEVVWLCVKTRPKCSSNIRVSLKLHCSLFQLGFLCPIWRLKTEILSGIDLYLWQREILLTYFGYLGLGNVWYS